MDGTAMKRLFLIVLLSALATSAFAIELSELRALAEQGFAPAQYYMGIAYDTGKGVPQNHTKAVKWYRMAAEQGHRRAMNNLAASYGRGEGAPRDEEAAVKWYRLAARQGDPLAQNNLRSRYAAD